MGEMSHGYAYCLQELPSMRCDSGLFRFRNTTIQTPKLDKRGLGFAGPIAILPPLPLSQR